MNWFTWLLTGFALGLVAKAVNVEWRMQMLSDLVLQELKAMRDEWKPTEAELEHLRQQFRETCS